MYYDSFCRRPRFPILSVLQGRARAVAELTGSEAYPAISGVVRFYQTQAGVLVYAEVEGLPAGPSPCGGRVFGFHIHEGTECGGDGHDAFSSAMSHYNSDDCDHPHHAGDLPPLWGNHGFALHVFLTDRFSVEEVIGKAVIIHDRPDDFTTQPSGNSGEKIACGIIRRDHCR